MPRYYCDYCDTYLTHDSPSVRKQHNAGYKHKANVRTYYQQYEAQLNQSLIDQKVKEHLGAAAFRPPVGAPFYPMRPGMPGFPTPQMSIPGQLPPGAQFPGIRPPVLPRPMMPGAPPGYMQPPNMPQMMAPHSAPFPGQLNGLQRPVTAPQPMVPGSTGIPASSGAPPMFAPLPPPPPYQGNMTTPTTATSGENSNANAPSP